ncbi:glycosyltransferase [Aegicerativicinus sediminis]|uniref:glycosyltransferase n=1 Tax=Aegicerativicinus sediminis TaxID=2893202 RepID=UPI001E648D4D|nr:glycosyltransferase [Aegicerativicinus sediminis]
MKSLQFSFVIPVFNRPDEIKELLESFCLLSFENPYEIIIVEDGSTNSSKEVCSTFKDQLNIVYLEKSNSGPGDSRNYGMARATGNYFIILDSDCILPTQYLQKVHTSLKEDYVDCFGGPDGAHESFSEIQKAINFVMTSFITTGGVRGNKNHIVNFEPRSFNMGISKEAFEATKGFGIIHPGEDPDLSIRLKKLGFKTRLISEAFVYHKRRVDFGKFWKQVNKFGLVRPILNKWHPESSKLIFWFPTLFVLGFIASVSLAIFGIHSPLVLFGIYTFMVFFVALIRTKSMKISCYSMVAMYLQFFGYGLGFFKSSIALNLMGKNPEEEFPQLFFNHG